MPRKILLLLLVELFLFQASAGLALEKLKFTSAPRTSPLYSLPVLAATEKGYWKGEGLDVEWVPFDSGAVMHQAVAARAVDMGLSGFASSFVAIAAGVPELIVADMQATENFFMYVRSDSPIREPKELKGATIGVTRFGSASHAYPLAVVSALGLEKEVKFVAAGGVPQTMAALKARVIDLLTFTPFEMAELKLKGEVREIAAVRDYLPREWMDLIIYARKDVAKDKPEAVRKTIRAVLQAASFVLKNRDWALEKMKSFTYYSEDAAKLVYAELKYGADGRINVKGLENARTFFIDYGVIRKEKTPSVDAMFTTEFLR